MFNGVGKCTENKAKMLGAEGSLSKAKIYASFVEYGTFNVWVDNMRTIRLTGKDTIILQVLMIIWTGVNQL